MYRALASTLSFSLSLAAAACSAPDTGFRTETVLTAGEKLGGCAVGDFEVTVSGEEIAVVSSSGKVRICRRVEAGWLTVEVAEFEGEMIQCSAGDVDPFLPGDELVVVGMLAGGEDDGGEGVAHLVRRTARGWLAEELIRDEELLHAVCIADLVPEIPGDEVVVAGYSGRAILITGAGTAQQESRTLVEYESDAKGLVAHDGGVVLGLTDGRLLWASAGQATPRVLDTAGASQARLGAADGRVISCRNDGVLALVEGDEVREVYREDDRLRGAVLADVDPSRPGLEAATAGYSGKLAVVYLDGGEPAHRVVFEDRDKYHHLAAGDVDGDGRPELVGCGYSGVVTLVRWVE